MLQVADTQAACQTAMHEERSLPSHTLKSILMLALLHLIFLHQVAAQLSPHSSPITSENLLRHAVVARVMSRDRFSALL